MFRTIRNRDGFSAVAMAGALIGVLIVVILGLVLTSVVLEQVDASNSTSSTTLNSIIDLVPIFWFLGLAVTAVAIVFIALRQAL